MHATAVLLLAMIPGQPGRESSRQGLISFRLGDNIGTRRLILGRSIKLTVKNSPGAVIYISPRIYDRSRSAKLVNRRIPLFARWRARRRGYR